MHLLGHFLETRYLARGIVARIETLLGHPSILQRPLACLRQGHQFCTAQTKVSSQRPATSILLTLNNHPNDPAPGTGRVNNQVQPIAIAMPPSAKVLHEFFCQLARERQFYTTFYTTK